MIPVALEIAWYILTYSKDYNGNLSDADCFRKMVYAKDRVNITLFYQIKEEMKQMSEKDMTDLKESLAFYGLL